MFDVRNKNLANALKFRFFLHNFCTVVVYDRGLIQKISMKFWIIIRKIRWIFGISYCRYGDSVYGRLVDSP